MSAVDGRILHRNNLKADAAYSYRVFADTDAINTPLDSPLGNGYTPFPGPDPHQTLPRVGVLSAALLVLLVFADLSTLGGGSEDGSSGASSSAGRSVVRRERSRSLPTRRS